jgi:amino acid permease
MSKARIFLILGIWTSILPYLGFPYSWKNVLFTITGLAVIFFSYVLYREYKTKENIQRTFDTFRENVNFNNKNEEEIKILAEERKELGE